MNRKKKEKEKKKKDRIGILLIMPFSFIAVLCEEAALIGVESDSTVFSSECGWPVSFPYCIFERTVIIHFSVLKIRTIPFVVWQRNQLLCRLRLLNSNPTYKYR